MKIFPVRYRPQAEQDIFEIAEYVLNRSADLKTSQAYVDRIHVRCERIGDAPFASVSRGDLGEGIRMTVFERRVVILCKVAEDTVWVTNIIFGGRDYETLFDRSPTVPPEDPA